MKKIAVYVFGVILSLWVFAPFLWLVIMSFSHYVDILTFPPHWIPTRPIIDNYLDIFFPYRFGTSYVGQSVAVAAKILPAIRNSLLVATSVTMFNIVVGGVAGYAYSRLSFKWKWNFLLFMLLSRLVPAIALVIPYFLMFRILGLMDNLLGLFFAYNAFAMPLSVWIMYSYFDTIPRDLDESALIDGCTRLQAFYKVMIPVSTPGLLATGIFTFLLSWNEFLMPLIISKSIASATITLIIPDFMGQFTAAQAWPTVAASGVLACIPPLLIVAFFQKYLVSGLLAGAVKG